MRATTILKPVLSGLFVVAMVAVASSARADLDPYIRYHLFDPSNPTSADTTTIVFYGYYPFDCGEIVNVQQPDPLRLAFTVRAGGCADTTVNWVRRFDLGVLAQGLHWLHVELTADDGVGPVVVKRDSIEFRVFPIGGPPPPPPPPPPFTFMPYISEVLFDPIYPNITEPTDVQFKGWAPFACGVLDVTVVDPSHVEIVVTQTPGCGDTTQTWQTRFPLGLLPLGPRTLTVTLQFASLDSTAELSGVLPFTVYETPSGPPRPEPGPPGDSLLAILSAARPNPFATRSEFGVSLDDPSPAEIAVFDIGGRRVLTLFDGVLPRGTSQFDWNGRHGNGDRAAGGIYFYRLLLPDRVVTRRLVLLGRP